MLVMSDRKIPKWRVADSLAIKQQLLRVELLGFMCIISCSPLTSPLYPSIVVVTASIPMLHIRGRSETYLRSYS